MLFETEENRARQVACGKWLEKRFPSLYFVNQPKENYWDWRIYTKSIKLYAWGEHKAGSMKREKYNVHWFPVNKMEYARKHFPPDIRLIHFVDLSPGHVLWAKIDMYERFPIIDPITVCPDWPMRESYENRIIYEIPASRYSKIEVPDRQLSIFKMDSGLSGTSEGEVPPL